MSLAPPPPVQILIADWVVLSADDVLPRAGLLVEGDRIAAVLQDERALAKACERLGLEPTGHFGSERVLAPGWVNAHAHLELSHLAGKISPEGGFFDWVRRLMAAKAETAADQWARSVALGVERLLATGTTCVGDIDSVGNGAKALAAQSIRSVAYLETLDAHDPARTEAALLELRSKLAGHPAGGPTSDLEGHPEGHIAGSIAGNNAGNIAGNIAGNPTLPARTALGLAPHAGFTASPDLLRGVAELAERQACPITIHWAETQAEVTWMRSGEGPMAHWLGPSPQQEPLEVLQTSGALQARTSLVHGNHPNPGDWERIARAGASVVHCPGSHAFFAREPFALEECLAANVTLALGTDSWASNDDLSMPREVHLVRQTHPRISAADALRMGTEGGAQALGLAGQVGVLHPGACADIARYSFPAQSASDALDRLTSGVLPGAVWVGGVRSG